MIACERPKVDVGGGGGGEGIPPHLILAAMQANLWGLYVPSPSLIS